MRRFDDCYPGCGGEDCICCEIFASHQTEIYYPNLTEDDDDEWIDE